MPCNSKEFVSTRLVQEIWVATEQTYVEEILDRTLGVIETCTERAHNLVALEAHLDHVVNC